MYSEFKTITTPEGVVVNEVGEFSKNIYPQKLTILMIKKFEKKKLRTHIVKPMKVF